MYVYLKESLQFHLRNVLDSTNEKSRTYLDRRDKLEGGVVVVVAAGIQLYTTQQEDRGQYSSVEASFNVSTQVYLQRGSLFPRLAFP